MAVVLLGVLAGEAIGRPASGMPPKTISAWTHEDANSPAFDVLRKAASTFNRRQHGYKVDIKSSHRRNYEGWVRTEAASGTLPCLLEFDGPYLQMFAWPQFLQPIDPFIPPGFLSDFLPSVVAQGIYQGRLYSLGQYDSGVGLWGNRRYLRAAGVRIPTLDAPWSLKEFEQALARLTALEEVDYAISFAVYARSDEFYSYVYAPILQGFGGDLLDRRRGRAKGTLDGPQSVAAMQYFQRWLEKGWTQAIFDRQDDFDQGKAALSWNGHWTYGNYHKSLGKDLVLMPLPDFGAGLKTGMGSWTWGITSTCHAPAGAWAFLAYLLTSGEMLHMTNVNGAMPARRSAIARSPLYGARGPLRMFAQQLAVAGVPRPATPAYATISRSFRDATDHIIAGGDVQSELSKAAEIIDRDIAEHRDFPYP